METGDYATFRFEIWSYSITPTPRPTFARPSPAAVPTLRPTGTAAATPTPTPVIYTVQAGDTLSAIADRYGVEIDDLIAANDIADPNLVAIGSVLDIPRGPAWRITPTGTRTARVARTPSWTPRPIQSSRFPCLSSADSQNMEAHERELAIMGRAFEKVWELADRFIDNPELWSDPNWQRQFTAQLSVIERSADSIGNLSWEPDWPASLHAVRNPATRPRGNVYSAKGWFEDFKETPTWLYAFQMGWQELENASLNVDLANRALDDLCR